MPRQGHPVFFETPASEEFLDAFPGCGGSVCVCGACGRTHYTENYLDEDEFADLNGRQARDPEGHVFWDGDGIDCKVINGLEVVVGCPCNYAGFVETLFWEQRRSYVEYLLERARREKAAANSTYPEAMKAAVALRSSGGGEEL